MKLKQSLILLSLFSSSIVAEPRAVRPDAVVDLASDQSADQVDATWSYVDAKPTADGEISPNASELDHVAWEKITPSTLETRRGPGKLSFGWYRVKIKLPERVGRTAIEGSTVVFETVVDDYAEVYINGKMPLTLGSNRQLPTGWNAPNRVVLSRNAHAGDSFDVSIFAMNGPVSQTPSNHIWIRSATLDLYSPGHAPVGEPVNTEIIKFDPALDAIIAPETKVEKLATDFGFCEGPVWFGNGLLFSDPNNNTIYRWTENDGVSVFRTHSGYTGNDIGEYHQPGSNGLAVDPQGRLTICEHGNRRVTRLEKNGALTVLADKFNGKRINSPNDLVYRSDGTLFFTDPYFGLPQFGNDPRRESPQTGVYAWKDGELKLIITKLTGPNGIGLSPDEKFLYVANWDDHAKVLTRYSLNSDGTVSDGQTIADFKDRPEAEALDGMKIDSTGNIFLSAPGGMWILDCNGKRLGLIRTPELPANFAWSADQRTLYLAARTSIYRMQLRESPIAASTR